MPREPFALPVYHAPDLDSPALAGAPDARWADAPADGVAPAGFHSTSVYPEYFKVDGRWRLAPESRMDASVVLREGGDLAVVENRDLRRGDRVALGRTENGEEGVYVHTGGFAPEGGGPGDRFVFRQNRSRETASAAEYDRLCALLRHEREHGRIVWVLGPACAFDAAGRAAMQALIQNGYAHAVLAGNALATHDLEAAWRRTALGQDIYTHESVAGGHYNHLDVINEARRCGSVAGLVRKNRIRNGIVYACLKKEVPLVLTGSIRDDGPLPGVIADAYEGQRAMRDILSGATTVLCLATMLHSIAAGNMTPSYRVLADGSVRPVYLYAVDGDEFALNKLRDRGSLGVTGLATNVQDFLARLQRGLLGGG